MTQEINLAPEFRGVFVGGRAIAYPKVVFDLDKTILFIGDSLAATDKDNVLMDTFGSGRQCFLPRDVYEKLKFILHKYHNRLVINTARDYYQVERLGIFREAPIPKYVICANGSSLYVNGEEQGYFSEHVRNRVSEEYTPRLNAILEAHPEIKSHIGRSRDTITVLEGRWFLDVYKNLCSPELLDVADIIQEGNKLIISAKCFNKGVALCYLASTQEWNQLFYAGDSLLDLGCLELAEVAVVPWGSVIAESLPLTEYFEYTHNKGVEAAGEVIQRMLDYLQECDRKWE